MVDVPAWSDSYIGPQWLVDESLGVLPLDSAHGYVVTSLDVGFPDVRDNVQGRSAAPGTNDATTFYGASSLALQVDVRGVGASSRGEVLSRLRAFVNPARRPVFYWDDANDGRVRRAVLRGAAVSSPRERPGASKVQVQWRIPSGVTESADASTVSAVAQQQGQPGVRFPLKFPVAFPAGSVQGAVTVTNAGDAPAAPVLRLWGPCTDPTLTLVETGDRIVFKGLSLTAGQYVEINVQDPTPLLNGRPQEPLTGFVVYELTNFFWFPPGVSNVRYAPSSFGVGSRAELVWRDTYI